MSPELSRRQEALIVAATSRTFRIFVSSPISDLKAERNTLQTFVFPRPRDLATAHGCRFQVIDLRWGSEDKPVSVRRNRIGRSSPLRHKADWMWCKSVTVTDRKRIPSRMLLPDGKLSIRAAVKTPIQLSALASTHK